MSMSIVVGSAQDANTEDLSITFDDPVNQGYDMNIKVIWIDALGKKQRTKGRLLLAHDNGLMMREETSSGRFTQRTIPARSIVKLKYSSGQDPVRNVILSTVNGMGSGGPIFVSTGTVYFDLLIGAVSGAISGLTNNAGQQRVVWVNRDSRIYRERVLPELGFVVGTTGGG